jgi:SAM-dependent methyltransferase
VAEKTTDASKLEEIRRINELQREFFNRRVDAFEPPLPDGVPERLKEIVAAGAIEKGEKVLDVGTGSGILIPYILDYEPGVIHVCDLAENMLQRVKEKFPHVQAHLCDVNDLDLADGTLDVVYINGCFSNIMDKERALANLYGMLRPKGRLVISHPLGRKFIKELIGHTPFPLDLLPDLAEAGELLGRHGFALEKYVDEPELFLLVAASTKNQSRKP